MFTYIYHQESKFTLTFKIYLYNNTATLMVYSSSVPYKRPKHLALKSMVLYICTSGLLHILCWLCNIEGDEEDEYQDESPCEEEDEEGPRLILPDPSIDTTRVEEIPAKEPKFHAVPLKSALKKPPTPTQEAPGPLK